MPARIAPNGKVHAPDEDVRLLLQRLIDGDGVPPRVSPGYVQPDPRQGGRHASPTNGASAPIWSSEPMDDNEGLRERLRSAYQALGGLAKRAMGHTRLAG